MYKSHLLTHTNTSIKILRQASLVLCFSPAYSTKKTQNAIRPRRRLPVSRPISENNVKVRNR